MKYKPHKLERVHDPAADRTDSNKSTIDDEIRRQAIADAERSFDNVRDELRRLVRSARGRSASEPATHDEHAP